VPTFTEALAKEGKERAYRLGNLDADAGAHQRERRVH
jgi:hypothetical protein